MHLQQVSACISMATTTMIAAVLCLLLFSGRLAVAEKTFGGGGGYGGLEAGGGQQQQQPAPEVVAAATTTPGQDGYKFPSEPAPIAGGEEAGGGLEAGGGQHQQPSAEVVAAATTTPGQDGFKFPSEPAPIAGGGGGGGLEAGGGQHQQPSAEVVAAATTTPGQDGFKFPSEPAPSTPAAEETPTIPAAGGGGYGAGLDAAGDPEVGLTGKAIKEIIDEHNLFRFKEKAGLPPLVWNATLAKFSQQYAETLKGNCQQIHSTSPYGENLMEGSPGALTWKKTVDGWSEEKKSYHYATDSCDAGKMCGHYKAVVWKDTTSVGCGRIKCNSGDTIIMCSYWPPGNYDGIKPY